jgi:hypothetical protein
MQLFNPFTLGLVSALIMAPTSAAPTAQGGDPDVAPSQAWVYVCANKNWVFPCEKLSFPFGACREFPDGDPWKNAISSFGPDAPLT